MSQYQGQQQPPQYGQAYYGGQPQQQYYSQPSGQPTYNQPTVVSGGSGGAVAGGYNYQGQQQYIAPQQYSQPPPQQYHQPPPPPPQQAARPKVVVADDGGFDPNAGGVQRHNSNERFAPVDGCRDVIWAVLFVAQVFTIFVLCIYYGTHSGCKTDNGEPCDNKLKLDGNLWGLIFICLASAGVFSAGYLWLVKTYPMQLIKFTIGLSIVLGFLNAIILFAIGEIVGGVFMLLFALLQCLWAYVVRHRIPFSATILGIAAEVINRFPAMVYVAYGFIVVQAVWMIIWIVAASSILNNLQNSRSGDGSQGAAVFFLLLSFYWTSQVLKNIVHVTASGAFASWYFLYPNAMPANPTMGALKRASWTSLGSIALGSLIIAVLQTMRAMIRMGKGNRNDFVRCCVLCILKCIEDMIRFFNIYAFTHVAVYGSTYCEAAKQTWALIKHRGWDLLINDQLISPVLAFGAIFVGLLCAGVSALIGHFVMDVDYWGWWAVVGFLIGFAVSLCAMEVVESCIATLFVCFAEDPEALNRTKPSEYNRLNSAFHGRMVELRADQRPGDDN